jgi:hydroxymethylglutaryl-CoA reductase
LKSSRISKLHRLGVPDRIRELERLGWLSSADAELLRLGRHVLTSERADRIVENVIGVFGLPFAIAPNFIVNGRETMVPMAVEEPSIVAGASNAARLAIATGGFVAECPESLLAGQIHITDIDDADAAIACLVHARADLLAVAEAVHPRLAERGGGVRDIEFRPLALPDDGVAIALHVLVDTCDAMGANLVNTICEALAPAVVARCGGRAALRILSNLADRSLVTARVRYRLADLSASGLEGEAVRNGIVTASSLALADPYRATTHNKGVMNGIDAVALATGNDWRALEAGAHAWAARDGAYRPLATWTVDAGGDLAGELRMPVKVGVVGGTVAANPAAGLALRMAGVRSARELAELMGAVGLAQNFAALRALAAGGIQAGHMKLHARGVAAVVGTPAELFDVVVGELVADGDIKAERAREILATRRASVPPGAAVAAGKVILLGEHAVVYGRRALAVPIPAAVAASLTPTEADSRIVIPEWGVDSAVEPDDPSGIGPAVLAVRRELGVEHGEFVVRVSSSLPRGMGLGSSAALAVAVTRAFNDALELGLDDEAVNAVAFECEKLAHGTPSGIDNAIATFGQPMLFSRDGELQTTALNVDDGSLPIVIACASHAGVTREMVAGVRARRERSRTHYDAIFDEIDSLAVEGAEALESGDLGRLGGYMNICHGLLAALEVSTPELDAMVGLARAAGAVGAKLTGAGGGGSIVALCPGRTSEVAYALEAAGFRTLGLVVAEEARH